MPSSLRLLLSSSLLTSALLLLASPGCGDDDDDGTTTPTPTSSATPSGNPSGNPTPTASGTPTQNPTGTPGPTVGPPPALELIPGAGIGGILLIGIHSYQDVQDRLTGPGEEVEGSTFLREWPDRRLRVLFADVNFNLALDATDTMLSATAFDDYPGVTTEGLGIGSTRAEVEAVADYATPDQLVTLPATDTFAGGTYGLYFSKGMLWQYTDDVVTRATVIRSYQQTPSGTIDFDAMTLDFGGGNTLAAGECDMSGCTGDSAAQVRTLLGNPDYSGTLDGLEVDAGPPLNTVLVDSDLEFYSVTGMQVTLITRVRDRSGFIDLERDAVIALTLFPPYYGTTAEGIGIGSTRSEIETTLGWSNPEEREAPSGAGTVFVYTTSGGTKVGVGYTEGGAEEDSAAVLFVFPFPE